MQICLLLSRLNTCSKKNSTEHSMNSDGPSFVHRRSAVEGEWMSGYCETGAQANKPHLHEMLMTRRGWPLPLPPSSEGTRWAELPSPGSWWNELTTRSFDTASIQFETSCSIEQVSAPRLPWTVHVFPISRKKNRCSSLDELGLFGWANGIAVCINLDVLLEIDKWSDQYKVKAVD
jgi:hypothetical protein